MKNRILVVDDEQGIRELYRMELESAGYEVLTAADSAEALGKLGGKEVHLIILDIRLKGESGLEMLKDLTDRKIQVPVIISSAYSSYKSDFSSWLAEGYVVKSSDIAELLAEVKRVLAKHHPRKGDRS
ncbi:MAG: response regulator [bacterium]|nr:MAG: response regulator [bacterium]